MKDAFSVNGFMFCTEHGGELCNVCCADYRMGNNYKLKESDQAAITSALGPNFNREERPALHAYALGAVHSGRTSDGYGLYQCTRHCVVDCETCFDWKSVIVEQAQDEEWEGRVHSRQALLGLLVAMGVSLPPGTKLPDDALNKKLANALDYSQKLTEVIGKKCTNPSKLPVWKATIEGMSPSRAMGQVSLAEVARNSRNPGQPPALFEDTLTDARQTLLHVARNFEMGTTVSVLQDKGSTEAICIRVLQICKTDSGTPLISLIYASADMATPPKATLDFVAAQMRTGRMPQITCTNEEQALLRKLLFQNSRRISSEHKPKLERHERQFKPSFLIPLYPLGQVDVGRLSHNTGCHFCGENTKSRCSGCQSVSYCGPGCQRLHWKAHKAYCRALKGATWVPMKFTKDMVINGKKMFASHIGTSETWTGGTKDKLLSDAQKAHEDNSPPLNIHADRPFLVKVQKQPTFGDPGAPIPDYLFVYDRQRSFKAYVMKEDNPTSYQDSMRQITIRNNRNKIYRWTMRTGDFELSVCLDRNPEPEPNW